jgi:hypothetical protein
MTTRCRSHVSGSLRADLLGVGCNTNRQTECILPTPTLLRSCGVEGRLTRRRSQLPAAPAARVHVESALIFSIRHHRVMTAFEILVNGEKRLTIGGEEYSSLNALLSLIRVPLPKPDDTTISDARRQHLPGWHHLNDYVGTLRPGCEQGAGSLGRPDCIPPNRLEFGCSVHRCATPFPRAIHIGRD